MQRWITALAFAVLTPFSARATEQDARPLNDDQIATIADEVLAGDFSAASELTQNQKQQVTEVLKAFLSEEEFSTLRDRYFTSIAEQDTEPPTLDGQYWGDRIVSEAFYALSRNRTGGSNVTHCGNAMSDWPYVESDRVADERISEYIDGDDCGNRGGAGGSTSLKDCDDSYDTCFKGGYCRYFVDLVLYRSSYGWGGGQHLVVDRSGTSYATESTRSAQKGWVIQANGRYGPHTAIVVYVYPGGLDVVDSNWTGGDGNFLISRHFMSWGTLDSWGFKAYNPWADPKLITDTPRRRCY